MHTTDANTFVKIKKTSKPENLYWISVSIYSMHSLIKHRLIKI